MVALVPVIVMVVGLLAWSWSPPAAPKVGEFGKILFAIGAFWFVGALSRVTWRVF